MKTESQIDLARAEKDPAAVFETPREVLDRAELSREQKLRILERWKLDALDMEVAAEENMAGGERSMLAQVNLAIEALDGGTAGEGTLTTKHGF